ncbi:MAG: C40 family peptidase, partial [Flavobacteriales bacterium]
MIGCHNKQQVTTTSDSNSAILNKYAGQMQTTSGALKNEKLYEYIDGWIGVKYKYGGCTKEGIDCSGFVQQVFKSIFNKSLERTSTAMVNQCKIIDKNELTEGDLVFFDISGKNSHVGIY